MLVYYSHKPILQSKWPLLQVCYKPKKHVPKHANLGSQCVFHKDQSLKDWQKTIQNWQSYSTFDETVYFLYLLFRSSYFQQKFNNFVNFDCFSPNFQGLILTKNTLTTQVDMLGDMFLWLVANLKQWPFTGLWECYMSSGVYR